jgi:malonyl-ACP O-methyltransferase BioC
MSGMSGTGTVDKCALAQQFSAAAGHYDEWATAQAEIAERLMRQMPGEFAPSRMVELGCGTGLLSAQLLRRFPAASLVGIDLARGMVEHCCNRFHTEHSGAGPRARFVCADVEDRATLVEGTELIASSCVAQWFADLPVTLAMWAQVLSPGGLLAFAGLIAGSFCELEEAYDAALGRDFRGLSLPSPEVLPSLFRDCGLRTLVCAKDTVRARYASARAALRSFQQIGAVLEGQPGHEALGPAELRRVMTHYDRRADEQGMVTVTHRVQYVVAERSR